MAVISLDRALVFRWPKTSCASAAHALINCSAATPGQRSWERRAVLSLMAATSPGRRAASNCTHPLRQRSNASGSSRAKTRP